MADDNKFDSSSIELLRSAAQNEYCNEHERTSTIDNKAGIALPIVSAYFLSLAEMNDFKSIISAQVTDVSAILLAILSLSAFVIAMVFALLAIIWMTRVVFTREYRSLNPRDLYTEDYLKNDCRVLSIKLLQLYCEAIEHNRNENNIRVNLYQKSWIYVFISVICFVMYIIIKNNIG
jgi:hypothetical protein